MPLQSSGVRRLKGKERVCGNAWSGSWRFCRKSAPARQPRAALEPAARAAGYSGRLGGRVSGRGPSPRVPALCVSTPPGLRPPPARPGPQGPTPPHPRPSPAADSGRLAPPAGAPLLPGQPRSAVSWSALERRPPCFPRSVPFSPDWCPRHAVVFQEPSPSNTLLSEFPAGFAFSLRLFGDTSHPPNPFLPVIFVIYMGGFL